MSEPALNGHGDDVIRAEGLGKTYAEGTLHTRVFDGLDIAVDMAALIAGEARITAVEVVGPVLILERAKDGRENWVFGGQNGGSVTPATPGVGTSYTLGQLQISQGRLIFLDHKAAARLELSDLTLQTSIPDFAGKVDIALETTQADLFRVPSDYSVSEPRPQPMPAMRKREP